jgi:hypothetical protein
VKDFSKPAIVILGYGLIPDGTMRTILRRRVLAGLTVAQFFPQSPIIVTRGIATFATESTWDGLADALTTKYEGIATRIVLYNALGDQDRFERYGNVARRISSR